MSADMTSQCLLPCMGGKESDIMNHHRKFGIGPNFQSLLSAYG